MDKEALWKASHFMTSCICIKNKLFKKFLLKVPKIMVQMDSLISLCIFLSLNSFTRRSGKKKEKKISSLAFPIRSLEKQKKKKSFSQHSWMHFK